MDGEINQHEPWRTSFAAHIIWTIRTNFNRWLLMHTINLRGKQRLACVGGSYRLRASWDLLLAGSPLDPVLHKSHDGKFEKKRALLNFYFERMRNIIFCLAQRNTFGLKLHHRRCSGAGCSEDKEATPC